MSNTGTLTHDPKYTRVFFFQAEDGIRDSSVTGVQTCALPISLGFHAPPAWESYQRSETKGGGEGVGDVARQADGDRKSVVEGKSGDLGGRRIIKKKKYLGVIVVSKYAKRSY